jgi:hypothetical protein
MFNAANTVRVYPAYHMDCVYINHRQILAFFNIKNDGVYLVCGGPGKPQIFFFLILGRESMRWQSFVWAG